MCFNILYPHFGGKKLFHNSCFRSELRGRLLALTRLWLSRFFHLGIWLGTTWFMFHHLFIFASEKGLCFLERKCYILFCFIGCVRTDVKSKASSHHLISLHSLRADGRGAISSFFESWSYRYKDLGLLFKESWVAFSHQNSILFYSL